MNYKRLMAIMIVFMIVPIAFAWGPRNHNLILDKVCEQKGDNEILNMCCDSSANEAALRAGSVIPDVSVIFYYVEGGKNYKATHNWNFQQEVLSRALTNDEKCFSYGIAFHLIADNIPHTQLVPERIEETKIPNWLLHPLIEKKWDSSSLDRHPELEQETRDMLNVMFTARGERYIEMMRYSLGDNIDFDVGEQVDNLAFALDSFYEDAYKPNVKDNSIFVIYPAVDALTNWLHPYIGFVNADAVENSVDNAAELTLNTFNNWGTRNTLSPHGFSELTIADEKAQATAPVFLLSLLIVSTGVPLYLVRKRRQYRWAWFILLAIPILVAGIAVIYAIV